MDELISEMKLEIGRMLQEGVSDLGIQVVIDAWKRQRAINPFANALDGWVADRTYAAYVEYGLPSIDPAKTVEGSLVEPITDESKLIP